MVEKNSFMSTREAAKEAGYSPRQLQNYITSGKLSATRGSDGKYLIDRSEFYRVFPDAYKQKSQENTKEISEEISKEISNNIGILADNIDLISKIIFIRITRGVVQVFVAFISVYFVHPIFSLALIIWTFFFVFIGLKFLRF